MSFKQRQAVRQLGPGRGLPERKPVVGEDSPALEFVIWALETGDFYKVYRDGSVAKAEPPSRSELIGQIDRLEEENGDLREELDGLRAEELRQRDEEHLNFS